MGCIMEWFGIFATITLLLQIFKKVFPWFYENILAPRYSRLSLKKFGKWAVITGATDGIGKEYAKNLAKNGVNVVLISRTISKLEDVAKEIKAEFTVETRIIDVDFKNGPEIYEKIEKNIQDLEVGILVNNVGMSYTSPEYFLSIPNRDSLLVDLIQCNITSVLNMTKMLLPKMVERNCGVVINISSLSAVIPAPLISVYAATKSFVDKFSDDLATEYKNRGIVIQSVLPGPVATNMSKIKKPTWMAPSAKQFVGSAIKTLGISSHTTGYYPHSILKLSIDAIDFFSPSYARNISLKTIENIRKRAIKRKEANRNKDNKNN
ncbi:very-long-chain 3-oxoacyl-CoA reductase-like [Culicoides brevitarsis]|uniref:very-long-chain 3-oxoacyl-CoA reductase-like n=1 Tax=Culicoides brevitarsis TaxID=469753 RepID=UPI00307C45C0